MTAAAPLRAKAARSIALAATLFAGQADARPVPDRPACSIFARIADPDPSGTNVRAAPSAHAAIVVRLPHERAADGDSFVPELEVIGFAHGWANVRNVRFADYGEGETMLFAGSGWISGRLLTASLTHMPVRDKPTGMSQFRGRAEIDDAIVDAIDDCSGAFAHVTVRFAGGRRSVGWTAELCANQATTCS